MIATRRGLAVLAAIAVLLALGVVLDAGRSNRAVDHAVVPGLDPARVVRLTWARPGAPPIALAYATGHWRVESSPTFAPDLDAIADVLHTLQAARWHRRGPASAAGKVHATLQVDADRRTVIGIGDVLEGADQVWLVEGDQALLVDSWVAHALDRTALGLRIRHPFATVTLADHLQVDVAGASRLELHGHPRRLADNRYVRPELVRALEADLAALELDALPDAPPTGASLGAVALDDTRVTAYATCAGHPDHVALAGSFGGGCVPAASWSAIGERAGELAGPGGLDRRPVPIEPTSVTLLDGAKLELGPSPSIELDRKAHAVDRERVAELRAALSTPATVVPQAPPIDTARGELMAFDRTQGLVHLYVFAKDDLVLRDEGRVALRLDHAAWLALTRPGAAYLDPTRWLEDPTTVTTITVDGIAYHRGAVLGEWTRDPAGPTDAALVEAAATALAAVRAPDGEPPAAIEHRVDVTIAPPTGAPVTHHLELGHPGPGGCAGRVDGTAVLLPLPVCTSVVALAGKR